MATDIALVEETVEDIAEVILQTILEIRSLGNTANEYGRRSARLNHNPYTSDLREKQIQIAREFALELEISAERLDELDPRLIRMCEILDAAVDAHNSDRSHYEAAATGQIERTVTILRESRLPLGGAIREYENLRETVRTYRRILSEIIRRSKDIDGRMARFVKALGKLNKRLRRFETLANEYIETYGIDASEA